MQPLKQSTQVIVLVGPVLDPDGAAYTSAVIGDFNLTKEGSTAAMSGNTINHSHNGHYLITLTTTNVNTLGRLAVSMNKAGYGMTVFRYTVLAADQYDALVTNGSIRPAAIADTTLSSATSGPSTGGNWPNNSIGRMVLIGASTQREVAVTGSNHVAADIHELQPAVITSGDFATDAISADAVSAGAVTKIVTGVWSALTSGLSVVGSTGRALARLIGLVEDSSGDRFTAKALEEAPSGSSTVQVLPALGVAAGRGDQTSLVAFVGETIMTSITVYQSDGTTAYSLSGKTLAIIFENPKTGDDVAVVSSGSITISGASNNVVTFAYPAAATTAQRELVWTMRDAAAPKTVYLRGMLEVRSAPVVDP